MADPGLAYLRDGGAREAGGAHDDRDRQQDTAFTSVTLTVRPPPARSNCTAAPADPCLASGPSGYLVGVSSPAPLEPRLTVTVDHDLIPVVVRLAGEIDVQTAGQLRETLDELSRGLHDVVLDMSGVEFMDSAGLGLLLSARKRGRITLRGLSDRAVRLMQMTGLYEAFDLGTETTGE